MAYRNEELGDNDRENYGAYSKDQHSHGLNSENTQENEHGSNMQRNNSEDSDSFNEKARLPTHQTKELTVNNSESSRQVPENIQRDAQSHEQTSQDLQYNRSTSIVHKNNQERPPDLQRSKSVTGHSQNDQQKFEDYKNNEPIVKNLQENKQVPLNSTKNNSKNSASEFEEPEERKPEYNDHSPIVRLLEPSCEGIRERIELLGDLISSKKLHSIPDVYDEMVQIIAATERNDRFQAGSDGKRLLELTTAARSNLNIDLHHLDVEIQRQFGLHSVEVTGDGSCAFRATLISGMQKPDVYHSELRAKAINTVLDDIPYYSTVLIPGEKVSARELKEWADTMADPNTYGDEMANMAVADRFHIQLVIFRAGELLSVINPRDGDVKHTAFLVNVGTHYKALVSQDELEEARRNSERLCK